MHLPIAFGRRFRRWHLLGVVLVVVGVWVMYALLFQLADSLISSMRYVKEVIKSHPKSYFVDKHLHVQQNGGKVIVGAEATAHGDQFGGGSLPRRRQSFRQPDRR